MTRFPLHAAAGQLADRVIVGPARYRLLIDHGQLLGLTRAQATETVIVWIVHTCYHAGAPHWPVIAAMVHMRAAGQPWQPLPGGYAPTPPRRPT